MSAVRVEVPRWPGLTWAVPLIAVPVAALSVAALVSALVLDPYGALAAHVYEDVVLALMWCTLGGILLQRMPGHLVGILSLVIGASFGIAVTAGQFAEVAARNGQPVRLIGAWVAQWAWAPGTFLPWTVLLLVFPDGQLRSTRWRPVLWLSTLSVAALTAALATSTEIAISATASVANPLALAVSDASFPVLTIATVALGVASTIGLLLTLRDSAGMRRRQLAPVVAAGGFVILALSTSTFVEAWNPVIQLIALPLLPLAVGLSVLRYRLYDLELIVRRSVVFVGLTVLVIFGYAPAGAGAQRDPAHRGNSSPVAAGDRRRRAGFPARTRRPASACGPRPLRRPRGAHRRHHKNRRERGGGN